MGRPRSSIENYSCEESTCEWEWRSTLQNLTLPAVARTSGNIRAIPSGDKSQARQEAKDRPQRRATAAEADDGRSISANLGTESGKSRCASTALASASARADAHADHESAAGSGDERGAGAGNPSCGANRDEQNW